MSSHLTALCFAFSHSVHLCGPALCAVHPRFELDNPSYVEAVLDSYAVRINRNPYSLKVMRGERVIAEGVPGGTSFVRDGKRFMLEKIEEAVSSAEVLQLRVATGAGAPVTVRLTFFEDNLLVNLATSDGRANTQIEESFSLEASGHWFGGNVTSGHHWPLETGQIELDPFLASSNQTSPIWLTSNGAGFFIPTSRPMGFSIGKNGDGLFRFNVKECSSFEYRIIAGKDIVEVYDSFIGMVGKPSVVPPKGYFTKPVFNTWIEFQKDQRQPKILNYARTLREHEFGCEVFMIDDMWQTHYGDHAFDSGKFPDPRAMVDELHRMGFKVVLWDVPFRGQNGVLLQVPGR